MRIIPAILALVFMTMVEPASPQNPAPETKTRKEMSPEEIIRVFSEKETEFYEAWKQYTYRQSAEIKILAVDGRPSNQKMIIESEVVFNDDGTRDIRETMRSGRLRSVQWTEDDEKVLNDIQPFALTTKELPLYDIRFEGKERVDELICYVFSVKPKKIQRGRLYFEGRIFVDDVDYQIVRTFGKPVPQSRDQKYPEFETIRQVIDDKYWFPVWTHADSVLRFPSGQIRIEETITYEGYRRFGSKATIDYKPSPEH